MSRVKGGTVTHAAHKKILKAAKGYRGSKHLLFKTAKEQVLRSWRYSYVSRRKVKSDYRKLWIRRINAACRENGLSYSTLMGALKKQGIAINRKMLSEMAIHDALAFKALCDSAKQA